MKKSLRPPGRSYVTLFIFATLVFVALIGIILLAFGRTAREATAPVAVQQEAHQQERQRAYEQRTAEIYSDFMVRWADAPGSAARREAVTDARDALLALVVPSEEYQDVHLDLVIALTSLEQGERGEAGKREIGERALQDAVATYPWLRR